MQRYTNAVVLREDSINTGNADEGAPVKVYLDDGVTPAVVFSDFNGTVLPQPFYTNTLAQGDPGQFTFVANDGDYVIIVNEGVGETRINDVSIKAKDTYNLTLAEATAALYLNVGDIVIVSDRADGRFKVISGTGTANGYNIVASTVINQSIDLITNHILETTHFGASPAATAAFNSGAIAAAIAIATPLSRAIHTNSGSYSVGTEAVVPSNVEFYGDGKFSTIFLQSALNTPQILISTPQGSEYQNIHDIGVRYNHDSIGASTQIGFKLVGTRRAILKDCSVDNLGQSIANYSGIGILMDMDITTNAYTNRIENNTVLGSTYGLWSKGPITSSVFTKNHFKTLNGMRFDRESTQAGSTAIFGNQIYGNLIQSHSSATFGSGNGLDFGQSDGALGFVYASSNQIGWNYIEQFLNGILLRDGTKNFDIASQSWDNATNQIIDLNTEKDGYSGFDAQNFELSTKDQAVQFTPKGSQFTSKVDGAITLNRTSDTLDVDGNGVTVTTDKRRIRLWGNGAPRTGAIISRASAIEGQRLTLIGFSWNVALSTTGLLLDGGVGATMGNGSGELALLELEYDASLNVWIEVSRNTRV